MKSLTLFFVFISITCFSQSQEEIEIKNTINHFFAGMKNVDSVLIKNSFSENAILQTITAKSEVKDENVDKAFSYCLYG